MGALITIAIIAFAFWLLGFIVFHIAGFMIHALLIIAVIAFLVWFLRLLLGRSSTDVT